MVTSIGDYADSPHFVRRCPFLLLTTKEAMDLPSYHLERVRARALAVVGVWGSKLGALINGVQYLQSSRSHAFPQLHFGSFELGASHNMGEARLTGETT